MAEEALQALEAATANNAKVESGNQEQGESAASEKTWEKIEALADKLDGNTEDEPKKVSESPEKAAPQDAKKTEPEPGKSEVAEDEEDKDVPAEQRDNKWYAAQRLKLKKEREDRKRIEKELSDAKSQLQEKQAAQNKQELERPASSVTSNDVSNVFRLFVKAANGEFTGNDKLAMNAEEQNQQVLLYSRKAIREEFSADQIEEVLKQAEAGTMGPHSEAIAQAAREALPFALSRELRSGRKSQPNSVSRDDSIQFNREFNQMIKDHPEFADPNSAQSKHRDAFMKKYIGEFVGGKLVKKGILPPQVAAYVLRSPLAQAELINLDLKNSGYDTLTSENKSLKEQLERMRQPDKGGQPPSTTDKPSTTEDAIWAKIQEQFNV